MAASEPLHTLTSHTRMASQRNLQGQNQQLSMLLEALLSARGGSFTDIQGTSRATSAPWPGLALQESPRRQVRQTVLCSGTGATSWQGSCA